MRLAASALIPTRPATLGWILGLALVAAPMVADTFEVAQGSVAGWAGEAESCGMDGRAWKGARIDPEPLIGNLDGLPMKP